MKFRVIKTLTLEYICEAENEADAIAEMLDQNDGTMTVVDCDYWAETEHVVIPEGT